MKIYTFNPNSSKCNAKWHLESHTVNAIMYEVLVNADMNIRVGLHIILRQLLESLGGLQKSTAEDGSPDCNWW